MRRMLGRLDRLQKRRRAASIAVATGKKFSEDRSTRLASSIAFWGFFSIFPLLLVLVTVLGWVLPASEKTSVLGHVAAMFPLLDAKSVSGLSGSTWALILGIVTTLWSGIGVVRTVEFSFNSVWEIPIHRQPGTAQAAPFAASGCSRRSASGS